MAGLKAVPYSHPPFIKDQGSPYLTPPSSSSERGSIGHGGTGTPTINLEVFLSLINPKNVKTCICCNTSLLTSTPPAFLCGKRTEILRSFCDILNLPYSSNFNHFFEEDSSEETLDFPFCHYCTNSKIVKLTQVYEKLLLQQGHFEQLKEAIMKDILRVFLGNLVMEKKVPLKALRESQTHDRMFHLFKRHSERKVGKAAEKGVQTEGSPQIISSPFPLPMASVVEVPSYNTSNKRRRTTPKKYESYFVERAVNRRPSLNTSHNEQYQYSNANAKQSSLSNIPMSPLESSCSFSALAPTSANSSTSQPHSAQAIMHSQTPVDYPVPVPLDKSITSFENPINGVMFTLDENGMLELEDGYLPGVDFTQSFDSKENLSINGLDQSALSNEFNNVLGLMEGLDSSIEGFSVEIEIPQSEEPIIAKKSSPQKSHMPEEVSLMGPERIVVTIKNNQDGVRSSSRSIQVRCEVCNKDIQKAYLKQHMETIHGGERQYQCRGCDKRFARKDHYVQHEERHIVNHKRTYFCHRCGHDNNQAKIIGKSTYVGHCVNIHGIEDDVVEFFHFCDADDCMESFKIRDDFLEHLATHWSSGVSMLQCSICDKSFADKKHLQAHQLESHRSNEPYYNCQFCHMGFQEENDFSTHIMFHKVKIPEERNYLCEQCDKAFETHSRLRLHRYNAHNKIGDGKPPRKRGNKLKTPPVAASRQKKHQIVSSSSNNNTQKPPMPCDICGRVYTSEIFFRRHMKTHQNAGAVGEENSTELDCEKESSAQQPDVLRGNCSTECGKYICSYCSKNIKTSHTFRRHLVVQHKDKHLKIGEKHCVVCWKIFPNDDQLQEHCDLQHKKFKCKVCGQMSSNSLLLAQHMKRHDVSYPFTCKICGQGFNLKTSLQGHVKKCHSKEILKPSSPSESDSDTGVEDEDLEELSNTLTPINDAVAELLNSQDPNSYDMLELLQM